MKKFWSVWGILLLLGSTAHGQQREDRPRPSVITVSGDATISAEPDQAQIDIGVVTQARNAPEASKENAERLNRVLTDVKKLLDKSDEVKTSGYSLTPNYRYPQGGKPEIVGYTATNIVRIKTVGLTRVGRIIDAAMRAGANQVNRLVFTLKDEQAAQLESLRMAAVKAKSKAQALAASLGLKIIRIASVNETERAIQPVYRQALAARTESTATPTPVEKGTVEIHSTLSLTVEASDK